LLKAYRIYLVFNKLSDSFGQCGAAMIQPSRTILAAFAAAVGAAATPARANLGAESNPGRDKTHTASAGHGSSSI
jgi:hypothetical protein